MIREPIAEYFVSRIWDVGLFNKDNLRSKDGRRIEVLFPGELNTDSGADFRNASIKIDGITHNGDVEVHVKNSDWRVHHHDRNPRYNSTILHVTLWDGGFSLLTKKQNGDRIPTLVLADYLSKPIGSIWRVIEGSKESYPCSAKVLGKSGDAICSILDDAGMKRLYAKIGFFKEQFLAKNKDQAVYEGIMDALGYSKNRKQFRELADKVPFELLKSKTLEEIQATLFGVAGLIPSFDGSNYDKETNEYIENMKLIWGKFAPQFQGEIMSAEQWNFFRLRPENFPTRRIGGFSYIIYNCREASIIEHFISNVKNINNDIPTGQLCRSLREILMQPANGYWLNHYTFGQANSRQSKFLIGKHRADDIIINIIFPAVMAHAKIEHDNELIKKTLHFYSIYIPLQDNRITRFFISRIFHDQSQYSKMVNSALRQQGLIHIYKSSCSVRDCIKCPFM